MADSGASPGETSAASQIDRLDATSAETKRVVKAVSKRLANEVAGENHFAHPTRDAALDLPANLEVDLAAALAPVELDRRVTAAKLAAALAKDGLSTVTWRRRRRWVLNVLGLGVLIVATVLMLLRIFEPTAVPLHLPFAAVAGAGGAGLLSSAAWALSRPMVRAQAQWLRERVKRGAGRAGRDDDSIDE